MSRIGTTTVHNHSLAAAFNSELEIQRLSDKKAFDRSGLRPKTPAQVKTFFDEVDKGLQVQAALAPVFEQYKSLRRGLRDVTSAPPMPAFASSGIHSAQLKNASSARTDSDVSSPSICNKKKRAERTCTLCASPHMKWKLRQEGNHLSEKGIRFVCTNHLC